MAILVPKEALKIGENLAAFTNEYKGKKYLNICKVYDDPETGKLARGKGLTILTDDFDYIVEAIDQIADMCNA